jgi:hypothetical protein
MYFRWNYRKIEGLEESEMLQERERGKRVMGKKRTGRISAQV